MAEKAIWLLVEFFAPDDRLRSCLSRLKDESLGLADVAGWALKSPLVRSNGGQSDEESKGPFMPSLWSITNAAGEDRNLLKMDRL